MEDISGKTLLQVLEEGRMLPVADALALFDRILHAMATAEREGLAHRDLKPSKIFIGHDRRVRLMVSGSAGVPSRPSPPGDPPSGTLHYMSPEQIADQAVDLRSDIFCLGVMFYEILTGERPFTAESRVALIQKILEVEPIPPRVLNINVPAPLDDLVRKALAKHPADRFQTPSEMLTALRAVSQSLEGAAGGSSRRAFANEARLPDAALPVTVKERGRAGTPTPPPPSGGMATMPRSLRQGPPSLRTETEAVAGNRARAWPPEPDQAARMNHAVGLSAGPETAAGEEARPGSARRLPTTLGVFVVVLLLVAGGIALWRLLATPVEQASPLPGAAIGPLVSDGQNSTKEGEPTSPADALVDQAKSLWESNSDMARKLLERAVALDPHHFDAAFQFARFLTFKKDFPSAIQQYQKALWINDQVPEVFFNLGYIYLQQGDLEQAIENYEACRALSPPYLDEVLTNLAVCYWKKNHPAQARVLLKQALDHNPDNNLARNYLNTLEKTVGPGK